MLRLLWGLSTMTVTGLIVFDLSTKNAPPPPPPENQDWFFAMFSKEDPR